MQLSGIAAVIAVSAHDSSNFGTLLLRSSRQLEDEPREKTKRDVMRNPNPSSEKIIEEKVFVYKVDQGVRS